MVPHITTGHDRNVQVTGSPYEQGWQHGEKAAHLIAQNVHLLKQQISHFFLSQSAYHELVTSNLDFLKSAEPAIVEEMQGIAAGAKIALFDIVLINLPLYFVIKWLPQECSSILARGGATFDGKTYLVKNRDMVNQIEHVILSREYSDGRKLAEVNAAGTVTYPGNGINSYGLAVSTSGVWSQKMNFDLAMVHNSHTLINSHLILEQCQTVDDAIDYLKADKRMSGMNFILADPKKAVAVEVTQRDVYVADENQDIIVRTNHYLVPEISCLNRTAAEYPSTYKRYARATGYLREKYGRIKFQDLLEIAADHENGLQDSLCRHAAAPGESTTVYSSMIVVEDGRMWTALCNPCEAFKVTEL